MVTWGGIVSTKAQRAAKKLAALCALNNQKNFLALPNPSQPLICRLKELMLVCLQG